MNELALKNDIQTHQHDWQFYLANFLRTQNGKSYRTIKAYEGGIKSFLRFLEDNDIEKPLPDDIHDYLGYLNEQEKSIFTVNLYMIPLKLFFAYLNEPYGKDGQVQVYPDIYSLADPTLKRPQSRVHYRERLTADEVKTLRQATANHARDSLMVDLALYCGLRVNEVPNVRDTDLVKDGDIYKLFVLRKGKTRKTHFVIVDPTLAERLTAYIKRFKVDGYLFYDLSHKRTGGHLCSSTVSGIISTYMKKSQIKRESITAHSLRHTAGTSFYQATKDIYATQQFLGHRDSSTTEIYMHCEDNYEKLGFALAPA